MYCLYLSCIPAEVSEGEKFFNSPVGRLLTLLTNTPSASQSQEVLKLFHVN